MLESHRLPDTLILEAIRNVKQNPPFLIDDSVFFEKRKVFRTSNRFLNIFLPKKSIYVGCTEVAVFAVLFRDFIKPPYLQNSFGTLITANYMLSNYAEILEQIKKLL